MTSRDDLVTDLQKKGVRTVVLSGSDTHGIMRGKRLPIQELDRILKDGMPLCDVFWVMHVDESELVPRPTNHTGYFPSEKAGYPDIIAVPDVSTVRMVPWQDQTALLLCDWQLPHGGGPVPIDPRHVLRSVVERARGMGLEPYSALELEFYLLRETTDSLRHRHPGQLIPLHPRPSTYGVGLGSKHEPLVQEIRQRMLEHGVPVEACNPETGPGQFEINLRYGPSLTSADQAFLFKSGVKELAAQNGLIATFMAKPNADWAGNSCHIHMSLRGADGSPGFYDASKPHGISSTLRQFVAGTLAVMPEFTALMAPNPNSYRRYRPYSWAGTTATWGMDNRSAGLRVICEGPTGTRMEHRQSGGDVNPYIATAAVLAAGLSGIAGEMEPPPMIDTDVYSMDPTSLDPLPSSLERAVDLLDQSATAREWLGADFIDYYVAMKRAELDAQARAVTDWEIGRYLEAL